MLCKKQNPACWIFIHITCAEPVLSCLAGFELGCVCCLSVGFDLHLQADVHSTLLVHAEDKLHHQCIVSNVFSS